MSDSTPIRILTQTGELQEFCERARRHASLAIDTEFERERTYKPILQLVQAATPEEAVIIDPLVLEDLSPLWELVADPAVETILHAAGQDLEIFWEQAHELPRNLFDTQVAGALLGMGEQPGYADLLRRVLDVPLKKHERVTDWGRRPLSGAQLRYALDDVVYLHELRDELTRELEDLGRREWLAEELAFYQDVETFDVDKSRLWLRVSRHRSLRARGLGILRELAAWREDEARRRNIPRGRVIQDEMLVEIARRQPDEVESLKALRRLHPREIERSGEKILAAVARGLALPEDELPRLPPIPEEDPERNITADLLATYLKHKARRSRIAASYLGTKKELVRLVEHCERGGRDHDKLRLLHGWRYELVGRELIELLEGKLTLSVDPKTQRIEIHGEQ